MSDKFRKECVFLANNRVKREDLHAEFDWRVNSVGSAEILDRTRGITFVYDFYKRGGV